MKLYQTLTEKASIGVQDAQKSSELQYLEDAARILSDYLNIETDVRISFDPPFELDKTQDGATIALGESPNIIYVLIDGEGLTTAEKLRVLAHEMVHVHQIDRGDLAILGHDPETNKITARWKDQHLLDIKYSRRNPWELEAHQKERDLQRHVVSVLGNYED